MKKKILITILLIFTHINTVHAINTRSQNDSDTVEGWTTYYHVTRLENLDSIRKDGLLTFYGGTKKAKGMSVLRNDKNYIKESMYHIHFGIPWEAATRYAQHMMTLGVRSYARKLGLK